MRVDLGQQTGERRPPWRRLLLVLVALAVVLITVLLLVVLRTVAVMGREAKAQRIAWLEARRSALVEVLDSYRQAESEAATLAIDDQRAAVDPESLDRSLSEMVATLGANREEAERTVAEIDRRIARWRDTGDLAAGFDRQLQAWYAETASPQPTTR